MHKRIMYFIDNQHIGCVFGLSASSWNSTHAEHHAMPQHVTKDSDLKTLPVLAFNKKLVEHKPSLAKSFLLRNQVSQQQHYILYKLDWETAWPLIYENRNYNRSFQSIIHLKLLHPMQLSEMVIRSL
jgi:hypothetical protein